MHALRETLMKGSFHNSPVDDVDHAVFTVVGAVNAELIQKIQQ